MFKRTWPVMCLVGTLCLVAPSLHANESSLDSESPALHAVARPAEEARALGGRGRPATPGIPTGDDDTPDRNGGSGGRGQMGGTTPVVAGDVDRGGWKMRDLFTGLRSWWIRYASVNR